MWAWFRNTLSSRQLLSLNVHMDWSAWMLLILQISSTFLLSNLMVRSSSFIGQLDSSVLQEAEKNNCKSISISIFYLIYKEECLFVCLFAMRFHTVQPISMKLSRNLLLIQGKVDDQFFSKKYRFFPSKIAPLLIRPIRLQHFADHCTTIEKHCCSTEKADVWRFSRVLSSNLMSVCFVNLIVCSQTSSNPETKET